MKEKDEDNLAKIEALEVKLGQLEKEIGRETKGDLGGMKKHRKKTFSFSMLSLFGFLVGFMEASSPYDAFEWQGLFGLWITFSLPLIVLWIHTKVFD